MKIGGLQDMRNDVAARDGGNRRLGSRRGQALVTGAVVAAVLFGMLGMVTDIGWAHFTMKRAQTAVDAAALAAVAAAAQQSPTGSPTCDTATCQSQTACPAPGNLQAACQYAAANGFNSTVGGRQTITVASGTGIPPGLQIPVEYWVQVTAQEQMSTWFSGFFGTTLTPSVRATAVVRQSKFDVSVQLLNRSNDCFVTALNIGLVCGSDFLSLGFNKLNAEGGIYMSSSNGTGLGLPAISAGTVTGNLTATAPFTYLPGDGRIRGLLGNIDWTAAPLNGVADGEYFKDPMTGLAQPPLPTGLPDRPVAGGVIVGSLLGAPTVLPPGHYYAVSPLPGLNGRRTPLGTPIVITGNVIFSDGQETPCGGFCNYVFHGGVVTGVLSRVTFSAGRYVFAGAQPVSGGPGLGLTIGVNGRIQDGTALVNGEAGPPSDAGEIFIFTDSNYPGLTLPADLSSAGISFPQARAGLMTGLNPQVTLHGLNASSSRLPAELLPYAPVLIWQDRANTTLKYKANGALDLSCGAICENLLAIPGTQEMVLPASQSGNRAGVNLYGTVYGPRGSWLTILGLVPGDTLAGPLQVITGSLQMTIFSELDLKRLPNPPKRPVMGLVE